MSPRFRISVARALAVVLAAPVISIAVAASPAGAASTINVPADVSTIQGAIDAASNGDTVAVAPGTYHEHVNFNGKAIEVKSSGGAATTTIDGDSNGNVVTFENGEGAGSILRGFTIQHAGSFGAGVRTTDASPVVTQSVMKDSTDHGTGVFVSGGAPTISSNTITGNNSCGMAPGMNVFSSDALIQDNTIAGNSSSCTGAGGGIYVKGQASTGVQIVANHITGNTLGLANGAGIYLERTAAALIRNNVIDHNSSGNIGGGIAWMQNMTFDGEWHITIVQNVIVDNTAFYSGGGLFLDISTDTSSALLVNNTVSGNTTSNATYADVMVNGIMDHVSLVNNILDGSLQCIPALGATPSLSHNDITGAIAGTCSGAVGSNGNIAASPHFFAAPNGNYRLQVASPSLDAGTNAAPSLPATDLDGHTRIQNTTVDQGAYEFTPPASTPVGEFTSLTPARLLDTRPGFTTIDGVAQGIGAVGEGATKDIQISGRGGVPTASQVSAVVLNATIADPTASSFLTVWPTGLARPTISNLNYVPGQVVPNLVTVALGTDGKVSVYNRFGNAHVIFDVVGYYSTATGPYGSRFHGVTPFRFFDTRDGTGGVPATKVGQGGVLKFKVTGKGGVPATGVTAVVMNVTVTEPDTGSFLTVYPDDVSRPNASNLNYTPGLTVPNLVEVRVPASGIVDFYNHNGSTHVLVDVVGYYDGDKTTEGGRFIALTPFRRFDSRVSSPFPGGKIPEANGLLARNPGYQGLLPSSGIGSMVNNVTVTEPDTASFVTAFPPDAPLPLASNLNFVAGQTVPNLVIVKVSKAQLPNGTTSTGWVGYFNRFGNTHLVIDVFGYFTASFTDVNGAAVDPDLGPDEIGMAIG